MMIDYKDSRTLGTFPSERGKIIPARITDLRRAPAPPHHRRQQAQRTVALLPYTTVYP
jgi:ribosomal protein S18